MNSLLPKEVCNIFRKTVRSSRLTYYSTQTAIKVKEEKSNDELFEEFEKISQITPKIRNKKPQRPPFAKNLFLGVYDTDILAYPELEKEDLEQLNRDIEPVENYFNDTSTLEYNSNRLSNEFVQNCKRLKLFGLQTSQLMGGRELSITESCRFQEIISENTSVAPSLLHNEQFGIQVLSKSGTDSLQRKYLQYLIDGKALSAFCMSEKATTNPRFLKTTATLSKDKKTWLLNGEKTWIVNGGNADIFIVVAQTDAVDAIGLREGKTTAFLVEKNFGGVITEPCEPMGISQTDISNVKFNNTPVPVENIIGEVNKADTVLSSIMTEIRLSVGTACAALTKTVINNFNEHCKYSSDGKSTLADTDLVRSKLGKMAANLYAAESTTYLTSGLLDQYENQDCELEAAIVKVLASEAAVGSTLECMDIIGTPTYMNDHWCNKLHRDALSYVVLNESNDNLKLVIALLGLQHAGIKLNERIKMIRNPLFHPAVAFKRMWTQRRHVEDKPKLNLRLGDYVHPSAHATSQGLEYCVMRLQFGTELLLARHGPEVIGKHVDLKRLAECVIDIYAMTACLARASRSYCIGLQHADHEIALANAFCVNAVERVRSNIKKIFEGPYSSNEENYQTIAKRIIKFKKYFPVHPLTRNY